MLICSHIYTKTKQPNAKKFKFFKNNNKIVEKILFQFIKYFFDPILKFLII